MASYGQAPANDNFTNSVHVTGTNVDYVGTFTNATLEAGEPNLGPTNTIWMSWTAPFTGRARYEPPLAPPGQTVAVAVYTGPAVNLLQRVRVADLGRLFDFLANAGSTYHFQMAGDGGSIHLPLVEYEIQPCTNDNFSDAATITGQSEFIGVQGATAEFGEPEHLGAGVPFKSLWWKWQAGGNGKARFDATASLATNVVLAVYSGDTLGALFLAQKGTNNMPYFNVVGGETYYVAAAVPPDAVGDILLTVAASGDSTSVPVPGNLLGNPSWETEEPYWGMSGNIGGSINASGGADGKSWPFLTGGAQVWQDFGTVPGRLHRVRFAMRGGNGNGQVHVLWDNQEVGVVALTAEEQGYWHWAQFTCMANSTTSRVTFAATGLGSEVDAFSVVSLTEPPAIVTQPASVSAAAGTTAAFGVGATGSSPLSYRWLFNGASLLVTNNPYLFLNSVTTNQSGTYQVIVTNAFGTVTSAPAMLSVFASDTPVIVWQPYGDTLGVGGTFYLSAWAAGSPPLSYQWFKNDVALPGWTNRSFVFTNLQVADSGVYTLRVNNNAGSTRSLPANLIVNTNISGGGRVVFNTRTPPSIDAPVFDVNGFTKLSGTNFLAQLYAGPTLESMRPAGRPVGFVPFAGYVLAGTVTIANVPPGSNAIVQVRAWDGTRGGSYEEARALGGKFGKSPLLTMTTGGLGSPPTAPAMMNGIQGFSLNTEAAHFATGLVRFKQRQPGGIVVWENVGEPGYRYLIEKSFKQQEWTPYTIVTNVTSTATFTDSANSGSATTFYRSRILD